MDTENLLSKALDDVQHSRPISITKELYDCINAIATDALNTEQLNEEQLKNVYGILLISNILYNNTSMNVLPLEDGIYDLLVVKYNKLTNGGSPVGAKPIAFDNTSSGDYVTTDSLGAGMVTVARRIGNDDMFFYDNIIKNSMPMNAFYDHSDEKNVKEVPKMYHNVKHNYPELVGTLHKCKFVLNSQAAEYGMLDTPGILTFERDFLGKFYQMGFYFKQLVAELKYDGISVEAEVDGDTIISARSRGDTGNDEATDLTPIFGGYRFPKAIGKVCKGTVFGIKFECIITKENMKLLEINHGIKYANPRNAIIGLKSRTDVRRFLSYMTLVPIRTAGLTMPDRLTEITFLNKYYSSGVDMKFAILDGDYNSLLFQVKKFTEEAEYMRPYMNFLYDGVVVSFTDPYIKQEIGRRNSVDEWSMAIKFNSKVKQTIFYGYSYSVGQNGMITPKAHFKPVEFLGGIHDKTTAHSLSRFMKLGLKVGDIVNIEYRNDVICYITKPDMEYNRNNPNPIIEFPKVCPCCGSPLELNKDSAYCTNFNCPERSLSRVSNMFSKLNFKDFSDAYVSILGITNFTSLVTYDVEKAKKILGDVMGAKLGYRINELLTKPIYDYRAIGSLGFDSIAAGTWKIILMNISIEDLMNKSDKSLVDSLIAIHGIGNITAKCLAKERKVFKQDLATIASMPNVLRTYGHMDKRRQVRFTGIRDEALEKAFNDAGFDADGNKSVTKSTDILIIPYAGFESSKTKKVSPNCVMLEPMEAYQFLDSIKSR